MTNGVRHPLFLSVVVGVVAVDMVTKALAEQFLRHGVGEPVLGEWLLLRLVYNPGAAFGIYLGPYSRWLFMALAIVALVVLLSMARHTPPAQWVRMSAIALVCGGAVGNLIDRVRSSAGVVDFIDVYIGPLHWPTFNVADMAVSLGAITLAGVLWLEGRRHERAGARSADAAEA